MAKRSLWSGLIIYKARTVFATSGSFFWSSSIMSNFTANSRFASPMMGYGKSPWMSKQYDFMSFRIIIKKHLDKHNIHSYWCKFTHVHPIDVIFQFVDWMCQQFYVSFDKMRLMNGKSTQFGGANGREITWMWEKNTPTGKSVEIINSNLYSGYKKCKSAHTSLRAIRRIWWDLLWSPHWNSE